MMWKAIKLKLKSSQGTIIAVGVFLIAFMAVVFAIGLVTGKINPTLDDSAEGDDLDCLNPGFFYDGQMYMIATTTDDKTLQNTLPKDTVALGKLSLTNEFPLTKELTTYKASLDGCKIWRVTSEPKWIYIETDQGFQLYTTLDLQLRWIRHDGKLYVSALDRDFVNNAVQQNWAKTFDSSKSTNEYFPKDPMLLGMTKFETCYKYPQNELGTTWEMYAGKHVYADANNNKMLFVLTRETINATVKKDNYIEIFLLWE